MIHPQPGILNIKPYVGGEDIIPPGYTCKVLLSSNENPLGASPKVAAAIQNGLSKIHIYPSGTARMLKTRIADFHGLDAQKIICANGSEDALTLLIRTFAGAGDEVLFSQYSFSLYHIVTQSIGGVSVAAPAKNYGLDVDALLNCVSPKTKIVIIDNPSNPIGSYVGRDEIYRLRQNLPDHVLLILDSAYAEYMCRDDYTAGIDLVDEFNNVVMTRTFSKFHGLAGLRLGWMYGPTNIIDYVNRIRAPFCCNSLVQESAGAVLEDSAHQEAVLAHNNEMLPWFMGQLQDLGLAFIPSVTNFVTVEFPTSGPCSAESVYLRLAKDGYIVRPLKAYGLNNHLRITMGLAEHMQSVVNLLKEMHFCDFRVGKSA